MKRLLPIIIAALLGCGFVMPETPADRAARENADRAWAKSVAAHYDSAALLAFLKHTIAEVKSWEGVSLATPKVGKAWKVGVRGMACGDWLFAAPDPEKDGFSMSFIYSTDKGDRWLILNCERSSKRSFRVVRIESEEVIVLDL